MDLKEEDEEGAWRKDIGFGLERTHFGVSTPAKNSLLFNHLFIHLGLYGSLSPGGLSLAAASRGDAPGAARRLRIAVASRCGAGAPELAGVSSCGLWLSSRSSRTLERRLNSCGAWA